MTTAQGLLKAPGNIGFVGENGEQYSWTGFRTWPSWDATNRAFQEGGEFEGHLLLSWQVSSKDEVIGIVARKLGQEELDLLQERGNIIAKMMEEKQAAREAKRREQEEAEEKREKETRRLAAIGEQYEKRMAHAKALPPGAERKALEKAIYNAKDGVLAELVQEQLAALQMQDDPTLKSLLLTVLEQTVTTYFTAKEKVEAASGGE